MVIHCTDPHQCHIIAVLFRQNGMIRFCVQPDFANRFFGDGFYDFAVFDSVKPVYGSRTAQPPMYFVSSLVTSAKSI